MEIDKYRVLAAEVVWIDDEVPFFRVLAIKGLYETYGQCPQDAIDSACGSGKGIFGGTWSPLYYHESYGLWIYLQEHTKDVVAIVETRRRFNRVCGDQGEGIWIAGKEITPELARLELDLRNEFMTHTGIRELRECAAIWEQEMQVARKRQVRDSKWHEEVHQRKAKELKAKAQYRQKEEAEAERKGIAWWGNFGRDARSAEEDYERHLRSGPESPSRSSEGIAQKFRARRGGSKASIDIPGLLLGAVLLGYLVYKFPSFGVLIAMGALGVFAVVKRRNLLLAFSGCLGVPILGFIWLAMILPARKPPTKEAPTPPPVQVPATSKVKHPLKKRGASDQVRKPLVPDVKASEN